MWIELRKIRESGKPLVLQRQFDPQELDFDSKSGRLVQRVDVDLSVALHSARVHVAGRVEGRLEVDCCRCLKPVALKVDQAVDLDYFPDPQVGAEGEEVELEYEELETAFYRDDRIDLQALINEQILLSVPMKPFCREDCLGLCAQCGRDLNLGDCGCRTDTSDPRLAALASLKRRMSDSE